MSTVTLLPPAGDLLPDGSKRGGWWHTTEDDRIVCDLCPRACSLKPGDRGFCFVRENRDGQMVLSTYGRSTGFCIDPIEKKPLNHFLPGTAVLSFGTAGCNLGCKFCQNWDISKSREVERLSEQATPEMIAEAAVRLGCRSVAYTYNDPVIWAEYAIDVARACREQGVKSVAVTAGYITPEARGPFYELMDAANVDLKAFTEQFYFKITQSHLQPVLDTLQWLKTDTDVWFEITNLLIPRANDSLDEIKQMCDWILAHVGDEVPVHFTAFHPDFRMTDRERTPIETLLAAFEVAQQCGLKYVYVGNVHDVAHHSTYCPSCRRLLIERDWHQLGRYHLNQDRCGHCGHRIAGVFEEAPGDWGRKRQTVRIAQFAPRTYVPTVRQPRESEMDAGAPSTTSLRFDQLQAQSIHRYAAQVVVEAVLGRPPAAPDTALSQFEQLPVMGSFVTLKRKERLRACCGFLSPQKPTRLLEAVRHAALRTAREDHRFPTISRVELPYLSVDVQLLHSPQTITNRGAQRIEAVEVGRHGLQIRRGNSSGLLLPVVAIEHGFTAEEFLRQVCLKAGLPTTAWQEDDTELVTFQAEMIPGPMVSDLVSDDMMLPPLFNPVELQQLVDHCRTNLAALIRGATPNYYLFGCSDSSVPGVAVRIQIDGREDALDLMKISLREVFPVQATLFGLIESAANSLRATGVDSTSLSRVDVSILHDPAMHGTLADADLAGVDAASRAVFVLEGTKSCWIHDPQKTPEQLLQEANLQVATRSPEQAAVYSLSIQSSAPQITFSSRPRPTAGPAQRAPAVAGTFYPQDPAELAALVEHLLGEREVARQRWPAVMVPHAGLQYSGRIAAQTLKRVEIPPTVIVIGPKHTRLGVDWAIAPHSRWMFPTGEIESDVELAEQLAEAVDGLELDAQAHRQEHAIEVELPFIARLAPGCRVVGIAMGGGSLQQCQRFAEALADVIRPLEPKPLLVISSDMNHYAPDAENRRLDEMALRAMETLEPQTLHDTVRTHGISMCGVLPAVVVMETLRQLGSLSRSERVDYATSGDVSGDRSRVVGYAGMLLG